MINMNPKYHLLTAVAALSLGACSTDDTCTGPENGGYKISFTVAEDSETRTTLDAGDFLRWAPNDKVGIYTSGNNVNSNTLTVADVNKSPVEFVGTLEQPVSSGDMFYAYYPYDAAQSTDPTAVKLSIPAEQKQTKAGVYNGESHPLVALPMEFSQEWGNAGRISSVRFRQLGAIVELQLYSSDEALRSEAIRSVAFVSDTPLAGDFSFDLTAVTDKGELTISGYESKEVTTSLEEPAAIPAAGGEAARVYLTIAPGQYTGQIVVKTDVAQYTFRMAGAMTFERAVIKGLPADLAKAEREIIPDVIIHFGDPEVKRICVENWDTNGDGELSDKEAAAVTSIGSQFQSQSIRSFNELQYFTGLRKIGYKAFLGCSSLTSIHIPDGVIQIEEGAFWNCSSLTSIHIPDEVFAFGGYAFCNCSSLTSIHIPDGMIWIETSAFSGCSSLTSVNIPQTVSSIGEGSFAGCRSLTAFEGKYASADHRCLIQDGTLLAFAPAGLTEYTIPDGVTAIGYGVFQYCYELTSIHIPDEVTAIGNSAFRSCERLTSITIPEGVTAIGNSAFQFCNSLTSITIPDGVTAIESDAFGYCSSLTSVYCKPATPPVLGPSAFFETPSSMQIYVPTASVDTYKTAGGWSEYASQIVADNN